MREGVLRSIRNSLSAAHRIAKDKKKFFEATSVASKEEIISGSMSVDRVSGIYFLIRNNEIVYVGQSTNVYYRIEQHRQEKVFDRITVLECDTKDLLALEKNYIKKFKPILNIVGINRKLASNLVEESEQLT